MNRKPEEPVAKAKASAKTSVTGRSPPRSQSERTLGARVGTADPSTATPKRRETHAAPAKEASKRRESARETVKGGERSEERSEDTTKRKSAADIALETKNDYSSSERNSEEVDSSLRFGNLDGESSGIVGETQERRTRKVSEEEPDNELVSEIPRESETDSFDEELELLRCQAELVEVAAELGTTSADEDFLTTDLDEGNENNDEDDGVYRRAPMQRLGVRSVVIEEDDEDISMEFEEHVGGGDWENDSSEIRSRLWAQSLLRLKRSIDEIYSLCEFESQEAACEQVKEILAVASDDFGALIKRLEVQQEYALLNNDLPFKHGVAWTTRAPTANALRQDSPRRATERGRKPRLEDLMSTTPVSASEHKLLHRVKPDDASRRSMSLDARLANVGETCDPERSGGGTGEAFSDRDFLALQPNCHSPSNTICSTNCHSPSSSSTADRGNQLNQMVQSALQRIQARSFARPSPEEIQQRIEERQRRARQVRATQDDQRMLLAKHHEHRMLAAKERKREKERQLQRELLEKMTKARRQYQEQLNVICQRARNENRKTAEVQYISKEMAKGDREVLRKKQENAQLSRAIMRESMRSRLIESANRIEQASERRRAQQEQWQNKITKDLEDKARIANERRQELLLCKKQKAGEQERRSELASEKRNEQERDEEKSSKTFLKVRSQVMSRLGLDTDDLADGVKQEVVAQMNSTVPEGGGNRPGSNKNRNMVSGCSPAKSTSQQHKDKVDAAVGASAPGTPASITSITPCGSPSRETSAKARTLAVAATTEAAASAAAAVAAVVPAIPFPPDSCISSHGGQVATASTTSEHKDKGKPGSQAGTGTSLRGVSSSGGSASEPVDSEPTAGSIGGSHAGHPVGRGGQCSRSPARSRSESPTWVYVGPQTRKARKITDAPGHERRRNLGDQPGMSGSKGSKDVQTRSSMEALMESSASDDAADSDDADGDDSDGAIASRGLQPSTSTAPKRTPRRKPKAVAKANAKRTTRVKIEKSTLENKPNMTTPRREKHHSNGSQELMYQGPATPEPATKSSAPSSPKLAYTSQTPSPEEILELEEDRKHVEILRAQLSSMALSHEEALKIARTHSEKDGASVNPANRTRINKLSSGLEAALKVIPSQTSMDNSASAGTLDSMLAQTLGQSFDMEKADMLIQEFCKVLGQSQRDADILLVLHHGCVSSIIYLCTRIKMCVCSPLLPANNPVRRQLNNVMLSSLKWLTVVSKASSSRVFLLLTNGVVPLAETAVACLDAQREDLSASEATLFLPQILHILSQLIKQKIPDDTVTPPGLHQTLVSCLLVCGLPEKLKDRFESAGIRGLRLFENSSSPLPLLFLRALSFLGTLTSAYKTNTGLGFELVIRMMRRCELFGIVSLLVSILLSEGRSVRTGASVPRLPQTVLSLCLIAVRILNAIARIDLNTVQETLSAGRQHELYHLLVCLLDYCTARIQDERARPTPAADSGGESREAELLHETIVLLGHYCLLRPENQGIVSFGEGQTLLAKITSLPLHYFMDEPGRIVLFPTILATCFRSPRNLELLRNEMNLTLLRKFITAHSEKKEEIGKNPLSESQMNLHLRFPPTLAQEALEFFADD